ncbi:uncharacterized protein [Clytia hemisphaerica]|uniref:Uncharacterized protein n=1 Tax=Clytia hemisphaerica TaxID=252671 RepID=A0A7M5XMK5_9CNID
MRLSSIRTTCPSQRNCDFISMLSRPMQEHFERISLFTMASSSYEIGGIFNVLQKTVAVDNTPTSSDEEEPKDTELANLFSFKPPEIIEDKDEENDIPDELIKEYISAEDKKPVEPKL